MSIRHDALGRPWDDDGEPTLELTAQQPLQLMGGKNTDVVLFSNVAVKHSQHPFDTYEDAATFSMRITAYHKALVREGVIALASLEMAEPVFSEGRFIVMNAVKTIDGPNLMDLRGQQLRAAVGEIVWSIRFMEPYEGGPNQPTDPNKLKHGLDTNGRNFIVSPYLPPVDESSLTYDQQGRLLSRAGTPVLVDYDPPVLRHSDGKFHLGHGEAVQEHFERIYGTRTGAMANLFLNTLYMAEHPNGFDPQSWQAFQNDWRSLAPADMHDQIAQDMNWLLSQRG